MQKIFLNIFTGLGIIIILLLLTEFFLFVIGFNFYPGNYYTFNQNKYFNEVGTNVYKFVGYEDMFEAYNRNLDKNTAIFFDKKKEANEFRIHIYGGSVCNGIVDTRIKQQLQSIYPHKNISIINFCIGSFGTDRILQYFHQTFQYEPDLILLHSGNNEFNEPILNNKNRAKALAPLNRFLIKHFRTYQLLSKIAFDIRVTYLYNAYLKNETFSLPEFEENCPLDEQTVLDNYEKNLQEIYDITKIYNVPIIFSTVTYNRIMLSSDVSKELLSTIVGKGNIQQAIELVDQRTFPEECPTHATTKTNNIIKKISQKNNIPLADIDSAANKNYLPYTTGYEYFVDAIHYATQYDEFENSLSPEDKIFLETDGSYKIYHEQILNGTYENMNITSLISVWTNTFVTIIQEQGYISE